MTRVVLDIETIPIVDPAPQQSPELDSAEDSKAALNALTGRIACIGLIKLQDRHKSISRLALVGVNEKALLERFWSYVSTNRVSGFVAHNGLGFDLPFLWKRSVINQVRPSTTFDLRRYRSDFVFDTMALWAHWDPRAYPKLDALAGALGVGQKSGVGTEVAALWAAGKLKEIADYCLHDCWLAYGCYCRMEFAEFDAEQTIPTEIESY